MPPLSIVMIASGEVAMIIWRSDRLLRRAASVAIWSVMSTPVPITCSTEPSARRATANDHDNRRRLPPFASQLPVNESQSCPSRRLWKALLMSSRSSGGIRSSQRTLPKASARL